ncbi:MAG: SIMPL domain-containing protein [Chloroflexota bacterium]|nr:SIMPL domain-containing protein [Chloroflexota bacterium]MDE2682894.1 SIMPL domain-containing protein [Chloroflexota bacterium]
MDKVSHFFRSSVPFFAAVGLLSLVACGTAAQAPSPTDGSLTPEAAPAPGQVASAYDTLRVSGVGKATGTPDLTNLALGVSVTAETVAEARNTAAQSMTDVLAALKEQGVLDADITTSHFRIHEEYDYSLQTRQKVGYTVSNGVTVVVRESDTVAAVIDAAVAAGGDHIEFNHISFSFSDTAGMEKEARQAAVADMLEKATQLAGFAGRELGDLKLLSDVPVDSERFSGNQLLSLRAEAAAFDTPIAVGEDDIAVVVYGVYELK